MKTDITTTLIYSRSEGDKFNGAITIKNSEFVDATIFKEQPLELKNTDDIKQIKEFANEAEIQIKKYPIKSNSSNNLTNNPEDYLPF